MHWNYIVYSIQLQCNKSGWAIIYRSNDEDWIEHSFWVTFVHCTQLSRYIYIVSNIDNIVMTKTPDYTCLILACILYIYLKMFSYYYINFSGRFARDAIWDSTAKLLLCSKLLKYCLDKLNNQELRIIFYKPGKTMRSLIYACWLAHWIYHSSIARNKRYDHELFTAINS